MSIYLGPEKMIKGWEKTKCRILYTDTYHEILNVLHKLARPARYIKRCSNYYSYILSSGNAWQLIRLKDQGFVQFEEMTLMQEQEYIAEKNTPASSQQSVYEER